MRCPPSRGRSNGGAVWPSLRTGVGVVFAAATAFDEDFFTETVLDVFKVARPAVLAAALRGFLEGFEGDFLRVFLDIRLPFVAFGGSLTVQGFPRPGCGSLSVGAVQI